jgi:hypothetical protein
VRKKKKKPPGINPGQPAGKRREKKKKKNPDINLGSPPEKGEKKNHPSFRTSVSDPAGKGRKNKIK